MNRLNCATLFACALAAFAAVTVHAADEKPASAAKAASGPVSEMRIYYAAEGKMEGLHARFRDHTNKLLTQHGAKLLGFWVDVEKPNKLIWIASYPSREAREATWKAFAADPAWVRAKDESEKNGKLVDKVEQVFMSPTDYSPAK